ncbi:hypothetical protein [Rhodohalobacter sp. 8-1]|uniref:hypothetical protein n=1 Tax=Rhodohalobacter sp. 8-1 TaxID=3131972 RepID=UPI0030EBE433
MKKPSDKQLETFVINPSELSDEEFDRVKHAIQHDEELRLIADWLRRFYHTLDKYVEGARQLFNEKKQRPSVMDLEPLQSTKKNGRRGFVLAAQTSGADSFNTIEQIRTFASKKYGTLIRVLNLKSRNTTKIDVISDFITDDDIVILMASGPDISLVTEPGGKMEISSEEISHEDIKKWSSCRVKLPVLKSKADRASTERNGYLLAKSPSSAGIKSIEIIQKENHIEICPDQTEENKILNQLVVFETGKVPSLWELKNGRAIVPKTKFQNKDVSLFFYS